MGLFGKPTLAQIYVKELRTQLDGTLVPLFTPDERLEVGSIGSFDRGQFVSSGSTLADEFGLTLPTTEDREAADWVFASDGAVDLAPEGTVSVGGVDLLKGRLSFKRDRAVVASFKGVTGTTAVWTDELNRRVWELYIAERLPPTSVVVWAVREAASGTVVVGRKSGTIVELSADPALLGGLLSLQGLAAGVKFTGGAQAAFTLTGPGMTPFIRAKGLYQSSGALVNVKGFQTDPGAASDALRSPVPDMAVDAALGPADWDEPEDGGQE